MLNVIEKEVYLYLGVSDMRMGVDRLSSMVTDKGYKPLSGAYFVFLARKRSRVKILYWDKDGYCLWFKRLEVGTFKVSVEDAYEKITGVDLQKLLSGTEYSRIKFQKNIEKVFMK